MKFDEVKLGQYIIYAFPVLLLILAGVFRSASFAYASCLALGLGFAKELLEKQTDKTTVKSDDVLRHKVEQIEAAVSAMVTREKARGW